MYLYQFHISRKVFVPPLKDKANSAGSDHRASSVYPNTSTQIGFIPTQFYTALLRPMKRSSLARVSHPGLPGDCPPCNEVDDSAASWMCLSPGHTRFHVTIPFVASRPWQIADNFSVFNRPLLKAIHLFRAQTAPAVPLWSPRKRQVAVKKTWLCLNRQSKCLDWKRNWDMFGRNDYGNIQYVWSGTNMVILEEVGMDGWLVNNQAPLSLSLSLSLSWHMLSDNYNLIMRAQTRVPLGEPRWPRLGQPKPKLHHCSFEQL